MRPQSPFPASNLAVGTAGTKSMRNHLTIRRASLLSLAITAGLIGASSDATAAVKTAAKSKKTTTSVVRAQNTDNPVTTTSAIADEEIFDKDLAPAAAQIAGSCAPNCTNVFDPNQNPFDSPLSTSPQTVPDQNSPLTDPNTVLSPSQPQSQMPAPVTSLGAGQGASTAMSYVPAFMGDFFGGAGTVMTGTGSDSALGIGGKVSIPTSSSVGIMKLAENTSPLPRDRVFLSYNYFSNVNLIPGGIPVNRLTPGIEKTFFGGNTSVEVRVPMALTLGSNTTIGGSTTPGYDTNQYELGNLTTFFKGLLYRDETFAFSAGLGVGAPTANSTNIEATFQGQPSFQTLHIQNQAWHLMPFIGSVYTPNDRFYGQTMLQFDVATNGNSVSMQNGGGDLQKYGALKDPAYLFASVGGGYWMYQNADPSARLSRVSLISELHFNTTLNSTNVVQGAFDSVGTIQSQIQTLNAVVGTNIMFGPNTSLLLGYVTPLGSSDQAFAGEFRVLFNWYFGGAPNRATRVQF